MNALATGALIYGAFAAFLVAFVGVAELVLALRARRRQRPFDWAQSALDDIRELPERERWLA